MNSVSYTLPIGKGKRFGSGLHGVGQALIGGWELQGIQAAQTGIPLTVTASIGDPHQRCERVVNSDPTMSFAFDGHPGRDLLLAEAA